MKKLLIAATMLLLLFSTGCTRTTNLDKPIVVIEITKQFAGYRYEVKGHNREMFGPKYAYNYFYSREKTYSVGDTLIMVKK